MVVVWDFFQTRGSRERLENKGGGAWIGIEENRGETTFGLNNKKAM